MVMLGCEVSTLKAALGVENRVTRKMFFSLTPCSLSTATAAFTVAPVSAEREMSCMVKSLHVEHHSIDHISQHTPSTGKSKRIFLLSMFGGNLA